MNDRWLPTLTTETPQDGIELAVRLSRLGVMLSRTSDDIAQGAGAGKDPTPTQSIAFAHVIALNFQTIAMANKWWQERGVRQNGE